MKKSIVSLALLFALLGSLTVFATGCGKKGEDTSSSSPPPAPLASSTEADPTSDSPSASATTAEDASSQLGGPPPAPIALEGRFYSSDPARFPSDRAPYVVLSADGTFEFHFNTGEGILGLITGTYEALGSQVTLTALTCDCEDFLGEKLTSFPFTRQDETLLVYKGEPIGLTRSGNEFLLEGATKPAPAESPSSGDETPADISGATVVANPGDSSSVSAASSSQEA